MKMFPRKAEVKAHLQKMNEKEMFIMKTSTKKLAAGFLAACLIVAGITTGGIAYAETSTKTTENSNNSLNEMLTKAISDEYLAQAEYDAILEKYGEQRPFINLSKAEETHINLLLPLLEEYEVAIPKTDWDSTIKVPESLEAAYQAGIDAETENIAMYKSFLKEDLPENVEDAFERLMNASENHLRAFQNAENGYCTGLGQQNGRLNNSGRGCGMRNGGNRNSLNGSCILQ